MRKAILIGLVSTLFVASVAFAAGRPKTRVVDVGRAVKRTETASSLHYAIDIRLARNGRSSMLYAHGARARASLFVHIKLAVLARPDGSPVPGPDGAALVDGPFLYERAPSGVTVGGAVRWLRVRIATLGENSQALGTVRALTPAPLLRVLAESHLRPSGKEANVFHGRVAYDDPIVRTALTSMTAGIEFRDVRVAARVADDGLIHRISLTGRTADGRSTLAVSARLFAFGRPVNLTPPAEGTFMDQTLLNLAE